MGTSFEYSKTLAMEGSILILLGLVPYVGWVLGIIGVILLLRAMREFANYYQDNQIYQNSLAGVKYYIVALIALAVSGAGFIVGFVFSDFVNTLRLGTGNVIGLAVGITFLVVAFVFYVLAAVRLRKTFDTLAQKTGEHSFETAGMLLWAGSLLTIFIVGLLLIFIAWIFRSSWLLYYEIATAITLSHNPTDTLRRLRNPQQDQHKQQITAPTAAHQ